MGVKSRQRVTTTFSLLYQHSSITKAMKTKKRKNATSVSLLSLNILFFTSLKVDIKNSIRYDPIVFETAEVIESGEPTCSFKQRAFRCRRIWRPCCPVSVKYKATPEDPGEYEPGIGSKGGCSTVGAAAWNNEHLRKRLIMLYCNAAHIAQPFHTVPS